MKHLTHLILNFTDTYPAEQEAILRETIPGVAARIDLRAISGANLYCDEEGKRELTERLSPYPLLGVHFLDSGNYHYLTRLLTSRLETDYALLFYDHHTDMQPASFDLLSCGSWAKECLEADPHLRKMVCVGPPEETLAQIPDHLAHDPRLTCISESDFLADPGLVGEALPADLPLYLSIDKDILRPEDILTNWDQGSVSLDYLCEHLATLLPGRELLGVDICGLIPISDPACTSLGQSLQPASDHRLLQVLSPFIKAEP